MSRCGRPSGCCRSQTRGPQSSRTPWQCKRPLESHSYGRLTRPSRLWDMSCRGHCTRSGTKLSCRKHGPLSWRSRWHRRSWGHCRVQSHGRGLRVPPSTSSSQHMGQHRRRASSQAPRQSHRRVPHLRGQSCQPASRHHRRGCRPPCGLRRGCRRRSRRCQIGRRQVHPTARSRRCQRGGRQVHQTARSRRCQRGGRQVHQTSDCRETSGCPTLHSLPGPIGRTHRLWRDTSRRRSPSRSHRLQS